MIPQTIELDFVTPLFSYGADPSQPEIRAASIRGQLHQWFRLVKGTFGQERGVFGGIKVRNVPSAGSESGSRLVVRVGETDYTRKVASNPTLPHKQGGQSAPKPSFPAGTKFTLHLSLRRPGPPEEEEVLSRAIDAWILFGGLGGRSTRAGGSIQRCGHTFASEEEFHRNVSEAIPNGIQKRHFLYRILPSSYTDERKARTIATDTLGGPFNAGNAASDLARLHYPLGVVKDKKANQNAPRRKTSPLKLKVARFSDGLRLIAVWDTRQTVTGNSVEDFKGMIQALKQKNKRLGGELSGEWV
mgnify:CR=1 FL=1